MPKRSAGVLLYRRTGGAPEVFLIHPGGPYFANKDRGAWGIPKGEYEPDEDPLDAAQREFTEETGFTAQGEFLPLGEIRQKGGKLTTAWAVEGDCDPARLVSNTCEIEWPPRSRRTLVIPEVDAGRWFTFPEAREFLREDQRPLLDKLERSLA
ncbi:MAG: NUDIX domain-containing protein [Acidobacteriota bacterium]|nr:NUDIX domain-containing protein [Acidobacteriota bacterium]